MKYSTTLNLFMFSLAIAAMLLSSCATIISGTKQNVSFNSTPSNARLQVNGIDRGRTPLTVKLKRSFNGQPVTFLADGYETKTIQLETHFNPVSLISLVFFAWPMGIDILDGAAWKYNPKHYDIQLDSAKSQH